MSDDTTPPPPPPADPVPPTPPPPPPETGAPAASNFAASFSGGSETLAFGAGKLSASDDKLYCILAQFFAIIIWLWQKDSSPAVDKSGKEALNFHITFAGVLIILNILSLVPFLGCLLVPVVLVAAVGGVVLIVIATLKTSEGKFYRYPFNLRLIK